MKNMIRSTALSLFLAAGMAYGAVPALNVTVSDASGKAAFKGTTNAKGTFATAKLKPGNYVVQFNSRVGPYKGITPSLFPRGRRRFRQPALPERNSPRVVWP